MRVAQVDDGAMSFNTASHRAAASAVVSLDSHSQLKVFQVVAQTQDSHFLSHSYTHYRRLSSHRRLAVFLISNIGSTVERFITDVSRLPECT